MHIDSYTFGKIVIVGEAYDTDCLIIKGTVYNNWWRKRGHSLCLEDLKRVIDAKPDVLVIGCGAAGVMEVPRQAKQALTEKGISVEILRTGKAVERFNELSNAGVNFAAGFHLAC